MNPDLQTCTVAVELLQLSLHYMNYSSVTCYYGASKKTKTNQSLIILFGIKTEQKPQEDIMTGED